MVDHGLTVAGSVVRSSSAIWLRVWPPTEVKLPRIIRRVPAGFTSILITLVEPPFHVPVTARFSLRGECTGGGVQRLARFVRAWPPTRGEQAADEQVATD